MKKLLIVMVLLITSCEMPTMPWQRDAERSDSYGDVVRTVSRGGNTGDFARTLNDLMTGPVDTRNCGGTIGEDGNQQRGSIDFLLGGGTGDAGSIKGEAQTNWNECKGTLKGQYVKSGGVVNRCKERRKMSKTFFKHFQKNFPLCVKKAFGIVKGQKALDEVEGIHFLHKGITGDSSHSNRSYHSINRAIDLKLIDITSGGKKYRFQVKNQKKGLEKMFFDNFRSCWHDALVATSDKCPGSFPKGSLGYEDKKHKYHMHLSMPFCPKNGWFSKHEKMAMEDGHSCGDE